MLLTIEHQGNRKIMDCVCDSCGKYFEVGWKISRELSEHNFCDKDCYFEYRKDITHHPAWKGGEVKMLGYVFVKTPGHPYGNELDYVKRSRLVMEKFLGRYLTPEEAIHHINENREDDRIENLRLCSCNSEHLRIKHSRNKKIRQLELISI